jgi:hypothetical protein
MTEICSEVSHHVLGCSTPRPDDEGFFAPRFSSPVRDEAGRFRNQQSRTWAFGVSPWFYPGLMAHSFFALSEKA